MNYLQFDESWLERAGALCTAREIAQQASTLARTQSLIAARAAEISAFLAPLLARRDLRVILTGAGSSAFIGECLAPFVMRQLNRRVEALATTDLLSGPAQYFQADVPTLLVSFGRSGGSPESVAVVELAERLVSDCHQLVFTCNEAGALYQHCRGRRNALAVLLPPETHDQSFAMTSSFTGMMLAAWLVLCGTESAAATVAGISQSVQRVLDQHDASFRRLATESYSRVVYLGSNGFKGLAREAALKLLEMTDGTVAAISDSPLGFRHGPKTFITPDTLIFVLMSSDPYTRRYDLDLLAELRADGRAGRVIAITSSAIDATPQADCVQIGAEAAALAGDAGLCFPYMVCGQLYALHRSLTLGHTPDQPSRSGTVSRVVRGVTIHPL
jgi:tagatose-6-phosphate ketose/aldose isomerase